MKSRPAVKFMTAFDGSATNMIVTWYERLTSQIIDGSIETVLREEIRKHILEDAEFRAKIAEGIKLACADLPLAKIAEAVKEAISGLEVEVQ